MQDVLNPILQDPKYHALFSIVKGFRNGLVYGAKVRFPHSVVMTFLFHKGSLREKITFILQATYQHARNLAICASLYRLLMTLLSKLQGGKKSWHTFLSAFVCGYIVFGEENKVNTQICLYILSRITFGLTRVAVRKGLLPTPHFNTFPLFAGLMWACNLWLFENHQTTLQPSLQSSLTYIFEDSRIWHNIWDLMMYNSLPV